MAGAVLELKGLRKKLGHKNVVDNLSLTVEKGEVFGLLGPNGAGKTTTIRMIVGLISKTGGDVYINGTNVKSDFVHTMNEMGAIVETPEMYNFLTGYKNLIHAARMAKVHISKERLHEMVTLVELEDVIHKKVKTYSLGMRQRLGVVQAMLHNPSLLILDEPTNGLDPQGIYDFRTYLRNLAREGISVMVSSHQLTEMQMMCDRVGIIQDGRLVDISSVGELTSEENGNHILVQFDVDDAIHAKEIMKSVYPDSDLSVEDRYIQMVILKEEIPSINKILVDAGIPVYGINSKTHTLEEKFLEITGAGAAQ